MKSFFILMAILFSPTTALYAQEQNDTVKIIDNARHVIVTRDSTNTYATIEYIGEDGRTYTYNYELSILAGKPEYDIVDIEGSIYRILVTPNRQSTNQSEINKKSNNKIKGKSTGFRHIYWGWHYNYGDQKVKDCFELGIRNALGYTWRKGNSEFETGIGFGMYRLLAGNGLIYMRDNDRISLTEIPANVKSDFSRLDIWKFNIPLIYIYHPVGGLKFCLGGDINMNSYAKSSTKFSIDGKSSKHTVKHLQQRVLTADVYASVNFGLLGIYATWNPVSAFQSDYGPSVKSYSIGLTLNF